MPRVAFHGARAAALFFDGFNGFFCGRFVAQVGEDHLGAPPRKLADGCASDASRSTRDNSDSVFEIVLRIFVHLGFTRFAR
jgi:hypothetical protein